MPDELLSLVAKALESKGLRQETVQLREETERLKKRVQRAEAQLQPVFKNVKMRELFELVEQIAPSEANVLIVGESGVGKEIFANRIHELSKRSEGPLIKLNCAAFPPNMIEGELFGYKKGAFTGASQDFPGMLSAAAEGTLFLDEIAEMPIDLQTRFLRVLQEREFRPLGSTQVDQGRLPAGGGEQSPARGGDPQRPPARGSFLPAQYLHAFHPAAARAHGGHSRTGAAFPPALLHEDEQAAADHPVGGLRRAAALSLARQRAAIAERHRARGGADPGQHDHARATCRTRSCTARPPIRLTVAGHGSPRPELIESPPQIRALLTDSQSLNLAEREKAALMAALDQCNGNKKKAAELLGIHRPTLYTKLKKFGLGA